MNLLILELPTKVNNTENTKTSQPEKGPDEMKINFQIYYRKLIFYIDICISFVTIHLDIVSKINGY